MREPRCAALPSPSNTTSILTRALLELYPQEITRALSNLISNGFYAAMGRKAETDDVAFEPILSATTRNLGETVEIRIRDNGGVFRLT